MICSDEVSRDTSSAGQTDTDEARIGTESVAFDECAFDSRFNSGVAILHIDIVCTGAALSLMPELDDALAARTSCLLHRRCEPGKLWSIGNEHGLVSKHAKDNDIYT